MNRILVLFMALALLASCAPLLRIENTTPVYSSQPPAMLAVTVVDHRPFILNDNKEEWFEGVIIGIGIPVSIDREFDEKPFALFLATKLKQAFDNAGAKTAIVNISKGTPKADVIEKIKNNKQTAGLIVMMHQSGFKFGPFNPAYRYKFELIVVDSSGTVLGREIFEGVDEQLKVSTKYKLADSMAEIYMKKFNTFLNSPAINGALTKAASAR